MIEQLNIKEVPEFCDITQDITELNYIGTLELLKRRKISIVGTRRPNSYTKLFTHELAKKLAQRDIVVVSGAAMGVDALAHNGARASNTIAVVANGLDIRYPSINRRLIENIEKKGLILSQFEKGHKARPFNFVQRNELVVALGEILIVTEADLNSGSLRSVEFALQMGKKIYTLPHRINESLGTNELLEKDLAIPIYNVDEFVNMFGEVESKDEDEFTKFCKNSPSYDEVINNFGQRAFEAELMGEIIVKDGRVFLE